jgi:hypothetical protein
MNINTTKTKCIVSGCGVSAHILTRYNISDVFLIGVNDIGRLVQPDGLVIVDKMSRFSEERIDSILSTKAKYFFTHLKNDWKFNDLITETIHFSLGQKHSVVNLNKKDVVDYSVTSAYMAVHIAYKLGFKEIGMIGVDFQNDHFYKKSGKHPLTKKLNIIKDDFKQLHKALSTYNTDLYNLSNISLIDTIPFLDINTFLK